VCGGVGWPSPAHAPPALASKIPKINAVALNRDTTSIDLPRIMAHFGGAGTAQPK
jgi:hypothetical protein